MTKSSFLSNYWSEIVLYIIAIACLLATAIQYPLSTTFPIGGDDAAHISTVQHIFTNPLYSLNKIANSWYPVAYILFSINALIPHANWPIIFSWWMALGQIVTGCALGFFAYRLSGPKASAIAIALWAMTPITMTSFFEDGTMAQLWSLPWIILFFERMLVKSYKGMALFAFLALFSHPITALVLICTLAISAMIFDKRVALLAIVITSVAGVIIYFRQDILQISSHEASRYIPELLHGFYLPWLLAALYGWFCIIQKHKENALLLTTLGSFLSISFLLGANDLLGIGFWTNRLDAYLLIFVIVAGSIGFATVLKNLKAPIFATCIASFLCIGLTMSAFHDNENIYKRYESPSTYTRIHPQELESLTWMNNNLPMNATIFTSGETRNYEWIPVLTKFRWNIEKADGRTLLQQITGTQNPITVFFTRKDGTPEDIINNQKQYTLLYKNPSVQIYKINSL